jgi:hypothetical protein
VFANIEGRAGYSPDGGEFSGRLTNKSANFIITEVQISLKHADRETAETLYLEGLWIEPQGSLNFIAQVNFRPMPNRRNNRDLFQWSVSSTLGLEIN